MKKVDNGQKLTDEEELYYLTKILSFSEEEAQRIIAISNNTDPFTLID